MRLPLSVSYTRVIGTKLLVAVTSEVKAYDFEHQRKLLTLVDTPGFDDSTISDRDILLKLLEWVKAELSNSHKLNGILYLHRIDAPRMQGSSLRNFSVFKQLCGDGFYKNVVLGTTCWDLLDSAAMGERRETELKGEGGFWHSLVQKGSQVVRVPRDVAPARQLVLDVAARAPAAMKCQVELSQPGGRVENVSAVKAIDPELERLRKENEEARRRESERLAREQEERERRHWEERERERQAKEQRIRRQEAERRRLLREEDEKRARREKEMREFREKMEREKREAEEKMKKERTEAQWQADNRLFTMELKTLMQASAYGLTKAISFWLWSGLQVCNHCFKLLEDEAYVGESVLFRGQLLSSILHADGSSQSAPTMIAGSSATAVSGYAWLANHFKVFIVRKAGHTGRILLLVPWASVRAASQDTTLVSLVTCAGRNLAPWPCVSLFELPTYV